MGNLKPFRFAASAHKATSKDEWVVKARRIEDLGYSTLVIPDHLIDQFAPLPALLAAADATTTLRVGSYVLNNDLHHPAVLAKEIATLDVLSGGRFEFGLGAGWYRPEYEQSGINYDPPAVRVRRLQEAIQVVKRVLAEEPASFSGEFYTITNLNGLPKPLQQPHPPLLIGGGGKQVLSLAAREANIVGLVLKAQPDGSGLDFTESTSEATMQKIHWIRQAAGERFAELELNIHAFAVIVTENPSQAIERVMKVFRSTEEQVLDSPYCLVGTIDHICETLQARREKYGISYIFIPEQCAEAFAPVVARLAGT